MFFNFLDENWKHGHTSGENVVFPTSVATFPVWIQKLEKHRIEMENAWKITEIVHSNEYFTHILKNIQENVCFVYWMKSFDEEKQLSEGKTKS